MSIKAGAMGTTDLLAALRQPNSGRFLLKAKEDRCNLSAILEEESPTDAADRARGVDAFTRLMTEADVVSRSMPEAGVYADTFGDLVDRAGRTLTVEWVWRQYRRAQGSGVRAPMTSGESIPGSAARPYAEGVGLAQDALEPAIPIAQVLAGERGIDSNSFRKMMLTEPTAAAKRFYRVGEGAPIPITRLTVSDGIISMYKFGRGLEITDEAKRRESLDRVAIMVQLMSVQNEIDKLAAIVDTMVNGDAAGYGAATNYNLTALDPLASVNVPTVKAWMAWVGKWSNPYILTTILATEAASLSVKLLNVGSGNLPLTVLPAGYLPAVRPINPNVNSTIALGQTSDAPAATWVGFDRRVTVERLFEIGAATEENERYASRQTEAIFLTEVEGYHVLNRNGAKTLTLSA